jgi:hypothetical protein
LLSTKKAGELRLRVVARLEIPLAVLLAHLGVELPRRPEKIEHVVPKIHQKRRKALSIKIRFPTTDELGLAPVGLRPPSVRDGQTQPTISTFTNRADYRKGRLEKVGPIIFWTCFRSEAIL